MHSKAFYHYLFCDMVLLRMSLTTGGDRSAKYKNQEKTSSSASRLVDRHPSLLADRRQSSALADRLLRSADIMHQPSASAADRDPVSRSADRRQSSASATDRDLASRSADRRLTSQSADRRQPRRTADSGSADRRQSQREESGRLADRHSRHKERRWDKKAHHRIKLLEG